MRQTLSGTIQRVSVYRAESAWGVVAVRDEEGNEQTLVGEMVMADEGLRIEAEGVWATHPKFGTQFKATQTRVFAPNTVEGIERFLRSGAVEGIGPVYASKIIEAFGEKTLDVIRNRPKNITFLNGIGEKRAENIVAGVRAYQDVLETMSFLHRRFGIARANKIFAKYGNEAPALIAKDPYRLMDDFQGIGFKLADDIATDVGVTQKDPVRLRGAVKAVLAQLTAGGHTCVPKAVCLARLSELLGDTEQGAHKALDLASTEQDVLIEQAGGETLVERPTFRRIDERIIQRLMCLTSSEPKRPAVDTDIAIPWAEGRVGLTFAPEQRTAIASAIVNKVCVITGGPGTGKTTILDGLLRIVGAKNWNVVLAAPTGRAASRMSECTGWEAQTIHRLLGANPGAGGFVHGRDNRLSVDMVIVDECSMCDAWLTKSLLDALPDDARLILVGDKDQLPSVGPGQVLADIIESEAIPVARLERPYRQAANSPIIANAHAIRTGNVPDLNGNDEAFRFVGTSDAEATAEAMVNAVCTTLRSEGFSPLEDTMVLVPKNKGACGVEAMNKALQQQLNPSPPATIERGPTVFGVGDRVIQRRNDRELGVFNGDVGRIKRIDTVEKTTEVDFSGTRVVYEFGQLGSLQLAYCLTVHRSQGTDYKACVIAVDRSGSILLDRKLLYTAVTRAKKKVVLVGQKNAVFGAVKSDKSTLRWTRLAGRLAEAKRGGEHGQSG